jgi:hypothetical protein
MNEVDANERQNTPLKDEFSQDNPMDIASDDDTTILTTRSFATSQIQGLLQPFTTSMSIVSFELMFPYSMSNIPYLTKHYLLVYKNNTNIFNIFCHV